MDALIYVSTAPRLLSDAELGTILETSRRNNGRDGITGMLLYADGNFFQVIEGEPAALDHLVARLRHDPRHRDIITVARYAVGERQFPDWSMGFRRMHRAEPEDLADAFSDLRDPLFQPDQVPPTSVAHKLLEGFRLRNRVT